MSGALMLAILLIVGSIALSTVIGLIVGVAVGSAFMCNDRNNKVGVEFVNDELEAKDKALLMATVL